MGALLGPAVLGARWGTCIDGALWNDVHAAVRYRIGA